VEALPGATAFVPALTASGLPCDRFVFEGFLPAKKGRSRRIGELAVEERTVVLYASPHRLEKLLAELSDAFGTDRPAVACRELTKRFETYHRGTLGSLLDWARSEKRIRGEIVLVLGGTSYHARLAREGGDSGPAT
jgi:16S rRNA (cytidine1402-2'-O)-methyltransferase